MMGWYHGGMGGGGLLMWVVMGVFWIALIAVIVLLVIKLLPGTRSATGSAAVPGASDESAEQLLDRMFALGEIDEPTYRARRAALSDMRRPS